MSLPTVIIRHYKERRGKCTVEPLVGRSDVIFRKYRRGGSVDLDGLPDLAGYVRLDIDGPTLTAADAAKGVLLVDGTWRYAQAMVKRVAHVSPRSLPEEWRTAYPRRQEDAPDPERGLASIEALWVAFHLLGRPTNGLFDGYHWKEAFFERNERLLSPTT